MTDQPEFDIYPKLDREIEAAVRAQPADGQADQLPEVVRAELEAAETSETIAPLSEEVRDWTVNEMQRASGRWMTIKDHFTEFPMPFNSISDHNPNFGETINRLYKAKQALSSQTNTSIGPNILDEVVEDLDMHLVFIPWQNFLNHLDDANFIEWLRDIRWAQGDRTGDDIDPKLTSRISSGWGVPLYHDPDNPDKTISWGDYLGAKIAQDGPWGMMLMQTNQSSGVDSLPVAGADELTKNGTEHLELEGYPIDAMGLFEWLAFTMQEEVSSDSQGQSWLLANYGKYGFNQQGTISAIPIGSFQEDRNRFNLFVNPAAWRGHPSVRLTVA